MRVWYASAATATRWVDLHVVWRRGMRVFPEDAFRMWLMREWRVDCAVKHLTGSPCFNRWYLSRTGRYGKQSEWLMLLEVLYVKVCV